MAPRIVRPAFHLRTPLAGLLALALLVPMTAHAQLGGLVKKAKGAATVAATPAPAKKAWGVEVTDVVIDRFVKGLHAERAVRDSARALQAQADKAEKDMASAMAPTDRYAACIETASEEDAEAPKLHKLQQQMDKAEDDGDDALYDKLSAQYDQVSMGIQMRAVAKCQPLLSAAMASASAMPTDSSTTMAGMMAGQRAKAMLQQVEKRGALASGFTDVEYAQLKEKVMGYYLTPKSTPILPSEAKVLDARRDELVPLLGIKP